MSDAIKVLGRRLKCDACNYKEEAEISRDLIGKKCPECDADMLTAEDYSAFVMQMAAIESINALIGPVSGEYGETILINPRAKTK